MSAGTPAAGAPAPISFDHRPLTDPVDRRAVKEWARGAGVGGRSSSKVALLVGLGFFAFVFLNIASFMVAMLGQAMTAGNVPWPFIVFFALMIIVVAGGILSMFLSASGGRLRAYRLNAFAQANGMNYRHVVHNPPLPGMIFNQGSAQMAQDLVRGKKPRFVEFGNYQYTTGSGKNRTTHKWGYVAIKLDVPLPHIVLDARGNNSFLGTNLPVSLQRDQRLALEGNFNEYFDLYCPSGYERDALYLFTPDIMARFIDNAAALDVEIVDDWVFFYSKRQFSTLDPATWAWLFSTVRAFLDKFAQWSRWRDDRLQAEHTAVTTQSTDPGASAALNPAAVGFSAQAAAASVPFDAAAAMMRPPPGVAAPGRRLRGGFPWKILIVVGVVVGWWLLSVSGIIGTLLSALWGAAR